MSELKPCPFCGGEVKLHTQGITVIVCKDCGLSVNNQERSIIKLTGQWNTRNDDFIHQGTLDRVIEMLNCWPDYVASENGGYINYDETIDAINLLGENKQLAQDEHK